MARFFLMWMKCAHKQLKHKLAAKKRKVAKRLKEAEKKAIAYLVETMHLDKVVRIEEIHLHGCTKKKEEATVAAGPTSCALFVDPIEPEGTTMLSEVYVGGDTGMSALPVIEPTSKDVVGTSVTVDVKPPSRGKKRAQTEKSMAVAEGQTDPEPRVKAADENGPVCSPKRAKEIGEESSPDKEAPLHWVQVDNRDLDQGLALMGSVAERSAVVPEMSLSDALAIVGLCCGQVLATGAFIGEHYLKAREYAEAAEKEVKDAEHTLVKVRATMDEQLTENMRIDTEMAELRAQLDEEKHARYKVENAIKLSEETQKAAETARGCAEEALKAAEEKVSHLEKKVNEKDNVIMQREQELAGLLEKTLQAAKEEGVAANKSSPIFQVDHDEMLLAYLDGAQRHIVRCVKKAYPDIPLQTLAEWMRKDQFALDLRELHSVIPYSANELDVLAKEDVEQEWVVWNPPPVQEDNVVALAKRS